MESNRDSERRKLSKEEVHRLLRERLAQWKLEDPEDALDAEIELAIPHTPHAPPPTSTPHTMESNKFSKRRKLSKGEWTRRVTQWKLEEDAPDAKIECAIHARTPHTPPPTSTPRTMESNKFSERRKLSKGEWTRRVTQWKLEEEALDAEIKRAIHARTSHAPPPTLTPRTFLLLGDLPMPLPSVVQQEVLLMVPAFIRKRKKELEELESELMGWENWKPAGPAGLKATGFGGEIGNTTAPDFFDAFSGRSSDGKTVSPGLKPAGPADPKEKVFVDEFRKTLRTATDIFDECFGHSSNEKTVDPAIKPAGPTDPNAKG